MVILPRPACSIFEGLVIWLVRIQGRIIHGELDRVSPLAVPVMLEIGRESVYGEASDELLAEAADELVKEAAG
jgi:ATP-dependent Lhr-like helicase